SSLKFRLPVVVDVTSDADLRVQLKTTSSSPASPQVSSLKTPCCCRRHLRRRSPGAAEDHLVFACSFWATQSTATRAVLAHCRIWKRTN
ncbi:jg23247, partial [Pararge aegeria aegeria]